jgi:hypothetical protein
MGLVSYFLLPMAVYTVLFTPSWTSTGETPARLELRAFFQSVTVRKFLSRQSGSVVSFSRLLHAALTQTSKPILPR